MRWTQNLKNAVFWPLRFLLVMWAIFALETMLNVEWSVYGLAPRHTDALLGIFTTPFLHGDLAHIISNSLPFFVLMGMIIFFYPRVAFSALLVIYLGTGVLMWLLADPEDIFSTFYRRSYHIGASGVVYGMAAFLAFTGFFRRNTRAIVISLVVVFYYGGMIWGVLPLQEGVSWEGHLLGAVMGVIAAYWYRDRIEANEVRKPYDYELEEEDPQYFLPRDVFRRKRGN